MLQDHLDSRHLISFSGEGTIHPHLSVVGRQIHMVVAKAATMALAASGSHLIGLSDKVVFTQLIPFPSVFLVTDAFQ